MRECKSCQDPIKIQLGLHIDACHTISTRQILIEFQHVLASYILTSFSWVLFDLSNQNVEHFRVVLIL